LPALANEVGKGVTLAAILSHPIGRWARRPLSLTRYSAVTSTLPLCAAKAGAYMQRMVAMPV
jgi:hypothetical protein